MIPEDFKQQLLNRVDIVDVVERYVALRKAGQNYVARCPFHSEKTPSFSVSPSKQFYHCFGCGVHGNAISFVMEHTGIGYIDAVKELAAMVGMTVPDERRAAVSTTDKPSQDLGDALVTAARFYKEQLKRSEAAISYLRQRGVSGEMAAKFGLGYAPEGWQSLAAVFEDYAKSAALKNSGLVIDADNGRRYDRFRERIMFPITDPRGNIIGFGGRTFGVRGEDGPKYLNSPETALFQKGRELFGLFQARQPIRKHGRVVVVEGYMDVVSLHQHGVDYAVATLGTATTPAHVEKLLKLADELFFCFDGDEAGRKAAWRALENALDLLVDGKQISFMFFPEGEDPDSYVRKCAESDVWTALPLSEFMANELGSQVNLETDEGRAKLLELAKPLLRKVGAPGLVLQLKRRFAKMAQVMQPELEHLLGLRPSPAARGRPASPQPTQHLAPLSLTRWILQAILNDPRLALRLDVSRLDTTDRFHAALAYVVKVLEERPDLDARDVGPLVLDALEDTAVRAALREAYAEVLRTDKVVSPEEFRSAVEALRDRVQRRRITELVSKADRSVDDTAELTQLQHLVSQRAKDLTENVGSTV